MNGVGTFFGGAANAFGFLVCVLAAFSALIVAWALIRTLVDMVRMGPLTYFRYALRIEPTNDKNLLAPRRFPGIVREELNPKELRHFLWESVAASNNGSMAKSTIAQCAATAATIPFGCGSAAL